MPWEERSLEHVKEDPQYPAWQPLETQAREQT